MSIVNRKKRWKVRLIENNDIKYEKLRIVIEMIKYIEETYNLEIDFDRRYANHYKLLMFGKEFTFNTYDSVLSALELIIAMEKNM